MSKAKLDSGQLLIHCPGCDETHAVNISPNSAGASWDWNCSLDTPTITPSLLVRRGHYVPGQPPKEQCYHCNEQGEESPCSVCHSYIRDGKIEFLSDCTHYLAGKTVELPEFPGIVIKGS